ncbi:endonuclease NucS domain-containing protein [Ornithinimicrobium ciconiae]|uniref:endonuclease NucS domain-containing protein n=1 Tax=Ornithinimicrobium ciconiae TaxID=2594265 RepID=UPI001D180578|nr:endonuclease NucS domain-containing protein [Ornithinimicrobium ciconiae]
MPSEATLESFLEQDPSLLGERLLVIGRQVRTPHGKYIDLLAMDSEGNLHVLELKRDRTPRDVVAQSLDYGSWVSTLDRDTVIDLANRHLTVPFEGAFEEAFGNSPPDELNGALQLTIVATELDSSSERIVTYLREFGVPINAVFFSYLEDQDRRYLARSWLASEDEGGSGASPGRTRKGKRAEWNGQDWFVSFGDDGSGRSWEDARTLGFVSAGGGAWYSRSLRALPEGARVNVHIPGRGYVAVGTTLREAQRFADAEVSVDGQWVRLTDHPLAGTYHHGPDGSADAELEEYVVPVQWEVAKPASDAYWEKGMFANQNSACKLRQEFTLERLAERFDLGDGG